MDNGPKKVENHCLSCLTALEHMPAMISGYSNFFFFLFFNSVSFKLQPYQLIGLKWLILLHQHKLSGILADEMVSRCHLEFIQWCEMIQVGY